MTEVHAMLRENPACPIALMEGADDLCAACPNLEEGVCNSPKPPVFDRNVLEKLLENGSAAECSGSAGRPARESCRDAAGTIPALAGIPASLTLTEDLVRSCCPDCQWQEICLEVCNS